MAETEMWLDMEAITVWPPMRKGIGHAAKGRNLLNCRAEWVEEADDTAHQAAPSQSYVCCESSIPAKNASTVKSDWHNLAVHGKDAARRDRRMSEGMQRVEHKLISPPAHVEVAGAGWPERLPWPVAVLFIFTLGIALWWGVFRLTSALLT